MVVSIMMLLLKKLFCFKGNEMSAFQGVGIMVTEHISIKYVPFCIKIHYMVHICNLTFKSISCLGIVAKIERLLQNIHIYFTHSTKQHLEFNKLVEWYKQKGFKCFVM
jgi:hypothetical protein